jgi:hypothetical protein
MGSTLRPKHPISSRWRGKPSRSTFTPRFRYFDEPVRDPLRCAEQFDAKEIVALDKILEGGAAHLPVSFEVDRPATTFTTFTAARPPDS